MKKYLIAATVAVMVFAISAFAASLDVNAGTLQAGDDAIDKCIENSEEAVAVSYGEAAYGNGEWTIDEITLDHDGKCENLDYQVVIADSAGGDLSDGDGTFGEEAETVTFTPGFDAEAATDVHLVIRNASN